MGAFRTVFSAQHVFLPVIHVEHEDQALRNARLAEQEGAHGIFLINHAVHSRYLFRCYEEIRKQSPGFWVGINCLDLGREAVRIIPKTTNGLWADSAGINESDAPVARAEEFAALRKDSGWQGIYFGGVAFKYQIKIRDVALAAKRAIPFVDVVTTSGSETGKAADVAKIRSMKEAIGDHPLAIASGITPENVRDYMPYADCFLVATGISDSHTELNPVRVRALAKILRG